MGTNYFPRTEFVEAVRWNDTGPHALLIMMVLHRWRMMGAKPPYAFGDQVVDELHLNNRTLDRALERLEAAGCITVDRHRGRLPRVSLAEPVKPESINGTGEGEADDGRDQTA